MITGGIPCQFRGFKHLSGADRRVRTDQHVPGLREVDRGEHSPTPSAQAAAAADEHRHVGTEFEPDRRELRRRKARVPHNSFSATRTVAASELPPPTPPCIGSFFVTSIATPVRTLPRGSSSRRAARTRQVVFRRHAGHVAEPLDRPRRPPPEADLVAQVDELEGRLQQVIAVRPAPDDVQEQVQLARRRPGFGTAERFARGRSWPRGPVDRRHLPFVHR